MLNTDTHAHQHIYTLTHIHTLCAHPQRSIEDEIERESQAEIITILISYLLMFVYIMFFLGHIRGIKTLLVSKKKHYICIRGSKFFVIQY